MDIGSHNFMLTPKYPPIVSEGIHLKLLKTIESDAYRHKRENKKKLPIFRAFFRNIESMLHVVGIFILKESKMQTIPLLIPLDKKTESKKSNPVANIASKINSESLV